MVEPMKLIEKHFKNNLKAKKILVTHSKNVYKKALEILSSYEKNNPFSKKIDKEFIYEACMLHDIGIIETHAPNINCFGKKSYILHGILGQKILAKEGLFRHSKIASRHTGVGISKKEIIAKKLDLPHRNFLPKTLEEEIICLADKFFSKDPEKLNHEKSIKEIELSLNKYGILKVKRFNDLCYKFGLIQ